MTAMGEKKLDSLLAATIFLYAHIKKHQGSFFKSYEGDIRFLTDRG